ncbi:MAG: ATP-binding protein [Desulfonauticus sp.]|nr:ATP-binding protein [Desulfonauticus sp.]
MLIKRFRGVDFINRDKEIEFFLNYFNKNPERVMWIYGPKSTGKTTLIEYVIENYLLKEKSYNIKYLNFRRILISNFDSFIDSLLEEKDEETQTELNRSYNIFGLFQLEAKTLKKIKEHKKNLFNYLIEEFRKEKRKNILIIDEIQSLQDIYMNGDKKLLNEFLNFCVALTKETHLSHVLILTSNTIFLNEIYNNSKMKETSRFKLIDHLSYEDIKEWLISKKDLGFRVEDIDLIYEYLGGSATRIKKLIEEYKDFNSLKEYLENEIEITKNEIKFTFRELRKLNKEYLIEPFKEIIKDILTKGYSDKESKEIEEAIDFFCEKEILFFDPIKNTTTANSKIYVKAFERLLSDG